MIAPSPTRRFTGCSDSTTSRILELARMLTTVSRPPGWDFYHVLALELPWLSRIFIGQLDDCNCYNEPFTVSLLWTYT